MSTHVASTDALREKSCLKIAGSCHTIPTTLSWQSQLTKLTIVLSSARCPFSQTNNQKLFCVDKKYRLLTQETTWGDSSFKESKHC